LAINHLITTIISNTAGMSKNPQRLEGRSVSAMVIDGIANYAPIFVFRERASNRPDLWSAVQDQHQKVREEAVKVLQAVIENIIERAPIEF